MDWERGIKKKENHHKKAQNHKSQAVGRGRTLALHVTMLGTVIHVCNPQYSRRLRQEDYKSKFHLAIQHLAGPCLKK